MHDPDDEPDPMITVCQGPPVCNLTGEHAIEAIEAGCPWCTRRIQHPDGTETVIGPAHA